MTQYFVQIPFLILALVDCSISVTEREVINGILNVSNTKNHCLAYVRHINNINLQNVKKASLFLDIINRQIDAEASRLLADLRDERLTSKIETTNYQRQPTEIIIQDIFLPASIVGGLILFLRLIIIFYIIKQYIQSIS